MDKQKIRQISYSIDIKEAAFKSEIIAKKVISLNKFKESKSIFIYLAKDNEVNTDYIIQQSLQENKSVFVPLIIGNEMDIAKINTSTKFRIGKFGIREPLGAEIIKDGQLIDLSIIPMVAFDSNLNRLGHGKGFYDKWLNKNVTLKIGICFEERKFDKVPIDNNDVQMDVIISEKEIYLKK